MSAITVGNIVIKDLSPKVTDPALEQYVPKNLFPQELTFDISGVNNALSNAIRRTVETELLVATMDFDYADYTTTDPFLSLKDFIRDRIRHIPINQNVDAGAVFELTAVNTTNHPLDVFSGSIKQVNSSATNKLPFNTTFMVLRLNPGKSIRISNIHIVKNYGYNYAAHVVALHATSVALDQKPINLYLSPDDPDRGIPSSLSNPRVFRICFDTNGTMPPKKIVVEACDSIGNRLDMIVNLLHEVNPLDTQNQYQLMIPGETHTIGNLIMKTALELYPECSVTYKVVNESRSVFVSIDTTEDISLFLKNVITKIKSQLKEIKSYFV